MFQVHERVSLLQRGRRSVLRVVLDPDNLWTEKVVLASSDQSECFEEKDGVKRRENLRIHHRRESILFIKSCIENVA